MNKDVEVYIDLCDKLTGIVEEASHGMSKGQLTQAEVDYLGDLLDMVKDVKCIIGMYDDEEEGGQSWARYGGHYMPYENGIVYSDGGMSYARGGRGGYQRRESLGRYTGDSEMISKLRDVMRNARDDGTRREIQKLIDKMGDM